MKALVLESYNQLKYKDFPDPKPGENEVVIEVRACGICGSDIHGFDGSTGRRIPPLIMGHEASGVIVDRGSNVRNWEVGEAVTFDSTVYNTEDWYSKKGQYNLSDGREVIGVSPGTYRRHGAFAEYLTVPEHVLYRIPEAVSFEQAAMVEPAAVALHAINLAQLTPNDYAIVIGTGMIGSFIIQLLKIRGIKTVFGADLVEANRDNSILAGAKKAFDANDQNLVQLIKNESFGRGMDVVFDAVGTQSSVDFSVSSARKGGKVLLVGNLSPEVKMPLQKIVTEEITIQGSCAINGEYEEILDLLATGQLKVENQITKIAPLSEGANWFDRIKNQEIAPGKVILVPDKKSEL